MESIGERAAQAIRERASQNGTRLEEELKKLGILKKSFEVWECGRFSPSAYFLQQMALAGYDVLYILTGAQEER